LEPLGGGGDYTATTPSRVLVEGVTPDNVTPTVTDIDVVVERDSLALAGRLADANGWTLVVLDAPRGTARVVAEKGLPHRRLLNVNLPACPHARIAGVQVTRLGTRRYADTLIKKTDPRGRDYYWIGGEDPVWDPLEGTDYQAVNDGSISVTPMRLDLNDNDAFGELESWGLTP
jgi:hypothetical protein